MNSLLKYGSLLLLMAMGFISCGDDENDQNENEISYSFEYDGTDYAIKGGGIAFNQDYDSDLDKTIIGNITLFLIDGSFNENDGEKISTDSQHGLVLEIDVFDLKAEDVESIGLKGNEFVVSEGGFFNDIISFEEIIVENGIEYGYPEVFDVESIDESLNNTLSITEFEYDSTSIYSKMNLSLNLMMENGKTLSGQYEGNVLIIDL